MGSHALITELDESDPIDQLLDQLFKAHKGDAKRLIARTFRFLEQRTSFFEDPDTSKVLARLLRDVQKPAIKSAQNNAGVAIAATHSPSPATKVQTVTVCFAALSELVVCINGLAWSSYTLQVCRLAQVGLQRKDQSQKLKRDRTQQ